MRKLFILLFIILGSFSIAQSQNQQNFYVPNPYQIQTINVTASVVSNGWAVYGNTCAGCASYYYKIIRSSQLHRAEDGRSYYYYYIYFFSNSYYSNGQPASTYLTNVSSYMDGQFIVNSPYVLATRVEQYFIWMRSSSPNVMVTFQVNQMSVY